MERVLVTGARGYLASLVQLYNATRYEFVRVSHTDVDFGDPKGVEEYFRAADFDVCLHMAADASTAHCEKDPEGTRRVNTESAIAVARACRDRGRRVVFISTEQCFNAAPGPAPFSEDDEQRSTTRYGQQKMEADAWIRSNVDDYLILRLSWMFGLAMPGVRPSPNILTNVMRYNAAEVPTKMGTFPQYDHPHTLARYAECARFCGVCGKDDEETLDLFIDKIEELKAKVGIKKSIAEYGISEETFMSTLDQMVEDAFDDQCTGANPRYPLLKEIKAMYLKAYYGEKA